MASEVIVKNWCDIHLRRDNERVDIEFSGLVSIGDTTRQLELCTACSQTVLSTLLEILQAYGQVPVPERTERSERGWPCRIPGCSRGPSRPYGSASGLRGHMLTRHDGVVIREVS
jgi:hypothetical protein